MRRALSILCVLGSALAAAGLGCSSKAECTAEITDGKATYKGRAEGPKGQPGLDREAVRDACRQLCAASKAEMLDACAGRCVADVEGAKITAKRACTDR